MKTNEQKIRELFGIFSRDYNNHMENTNHTLVQYKIIDEYINDIKGKVLDLAAGTGVISKYIKDNTNCHIFGIDYCKEMMEEAKKKSKGIEYIIGDTHKLPFNENDFDTVICSYGFYWFKDIEKVISEIKRVLKPGGKFISLEEEFKDNDPKPRFSKYEEDYLKELANLDNYTGINFLIKSFKMKRFRLVRRLDLPIDNYHETVGLLWENSK